MQDRINQLKDMLKAQPDEAFILFALGKEFEGMGDLDQAKTFYLRLYEVDPEYVGLYYHLAHLYLLLEDKDTAMKYFDEGVQIANKLGDLHAKSELMNARMNAMLED